MHPNEELVADPGTYGRIRQEIEKILDPKKRAAMLHALEAQVARQGEEMDNDNVDK